MRGLFGAMADGAPGAKAQVLDMLPSFLLSPESKSGQAVSFATALQVTAVMACCKVIAEGVAQAPCKVLKSRPGRGGADAAIDEPIFNLLYRRPNGWQTAFEFWETLVLHLGLVGNAYVYKSLTATGRILELIPLEPGKVTVTRLPDLSLVYSVTDAEGRTRTFDATLIWHLRGPSWNSWMGLEPVKLAREAIGLALATEEAHARLHQNGVAPSGVYSVTPTLTEPQHTKLTAWIKAHASGANRGAPLILDNGATWLSTQMTGVDAQHLETRRFQIEEICRAWRVMPIMVGLAEKTATYAGAEQMFLAHVTHTLGPWVGRIEQSVDVNLLGDRPDLYVKFNLSALMRGDYKSRQEGLQIQRRNGVINANDWRELEDMNPRDDDGGSQYIVEGNMAVQDGRDLSPSATPNAVPAGA